MLKCTYCKCELLKDAICQENRDDEYILALKEIESTNQEDNYKLHCSNCEKIMNDMIDTDEEVSFENQIYIQYNIIRWISLSLLIIVTTILVIFFNQINAILIGLFVVLNILFFISFILFLGLTKYKHKKISTLIDKKMIDKYNKK